MPQDSYTQKVKAASTAVLFSVLACASGLHAQQWNTRGPVPRSSHTAVYDPATGRMIVFGGVPDSYITSRNLNDVFWLSNAGSLVRSMVWQAVNPTGRPPAPRIGPSAVYDSSNSRMIVFGGGLGRTSPCENDTWILNNANGVAGTPAWLSLTATGTAPTARLWHAAVYDPGSNRMIIFGGSDCFSTFFNDVWVLSNANGLGGTASWTQLSPSGTPPSPRSNMQAVYDPTNNIMIISGGWSPFSNDVWILSNANGIGGTPQWTQLSPSNSPPAARAGHSAIYDATNNRMTIFGGNNGSGLFNDVWVLSGANGISGPPSWTQLSPTGNVPPEPRDSHTAVYDPASNTMIIFAGSIDTLEIPGNDVFVLQHANGL